MLNFEQFIFEQTDYKDSFYNQIYYSVLEKPNGNQNMSKEKAEIKSKKLYNKYNTPNFKKWFNGSVVRNEHSYNELHKGDKSPMMVYHSSYSDFSEFKTPAFFGGSHPNAYHGEYYYYCVLQLKNPLEMRHFDLGHDKWMKLVADILKDVPRFESRMEFAQKYADGYGFFKLLEGDGFGDSYRWDLVYDYINKHGYDGAIYRESDQSISWYFDGYLVMKPQQIKIIYKQSLLDND
jgi:hypothetical protein